MTTRRFTFPRTRRLSGRKAFAQVFRGKRSAGNKLLVVYIMPNELPYARLGLTVSRRIGNAVVRNRVKRLLREAFRLEIEALRSGYDLICIPRAGVIGSLEDYRKAIRTVSERAMRHRTNRR